MTDKDEKDDGPGKAYCVFFGVIVGYWIGFMLTLALFRPDLFFGPHIG
jgi:hypothetical protein